jgi:hypothetical protein
MNIVTVAGADSLPAVSEAMTSTEFSPNLPWVFRVTGMSLCAAEIAAA